MVVWLQALGAAAGPAEVLGLQEPAAAGRDGEEPAAGRPAHPDAPRGDEGVLRRRLPLPQQLQRLVTSHLGAAANGPRQRQGVPRWRVEICVFRDRNLRAFAYKTSLQPVVIFQKRVERDYLQR